jgi:hypothetical protein
MEPINSTTHGITNPQPFQTLHQIQITISNHNLELVPSHHHSIIVHKPTSRPQFNSSLHNQTKSESTQYHQKPTHSQTNLLRTKHHPTATITISVPKSIPLNP